MAKYGQFKYGQAKYGKSAPRWIYDRTQQDLINETEKAFINYWDLNRIESRMFELSNILNSMGYIQKINTKTDWKKQTSTNDLSNIPTYYHINRLHNNEDKLLKNFFVYPTTPKLPTTFENLNIDKANAVEKILYDMHNIAKGIINDYKKCNLITCGGGNLI